MSWLPSPITDRAALGLEIDFNLVALQRVLVELQSSLDQGYIKRLLLRRSWARKFQKVLNDTRRATRLAMGQLQLTLRGIVATLPLPEKFGDAQNRGERIIEFVGDAGEHLAHGSKFFGLDKLFFKTFDVGDVAAGDNHAVDLVRFVEERAQMTTQAAPLAVLPSYPHFQRSETLFSGENIVEQSSQRGAIFPVSAVAKPFHRIPRVRSPGCP